MRSREGPANGAILIEVVLDAYADQTIEQLEARALAQETRDAADAEAAAARADATSSSTSRDVQDRSTAYRDYDTIFDLVEELGNKPMSIRMLSRNAWVGTGAGSYVLELIGKGYVKVVKEAGKS